MKKIGFIGTGSMGKLLIKQLIETGVILPQSIIAHSKFNLSAQDLASETGINVYESNRELAHEADIIFICVKPLDVKGVLEEIRDDLTSEKILISIAGCVSLTNIANWAGLEIPAAKIIPSITMEKRSGISLVAWNEDISPSDKELVNSLLMAISTPVEIDESQFELLADLTSSAPAFFTAIMQEYASTAVLKGKISLELAEKLILQTMIGTTRILDPGGTNFDEIINRVATKGGITEEGIKILRERLPAVFSELLDTTLSKRELIKNCIAQNET